jgi:ubiquinone/menaquinone biosynthesis C-methylase UbiE
MAPSREEHARLAWIADEHNEYAREACRRAGLGSGQRAIDVGCGPLGALPVLGELAGPTGEVAGLDASAEALATARALLDERSLQRVRLVHGNLYETAPEAVARDGLFDLAYCRLFLIHQPDPVAALRHMAALVRPGGWIVAHEALDEEGFASAEPPLPAYGRVWQLVMATLRQRGTRFDVARHFGEVCAAAGLDLVAQRGYFAFHQPGPGIAARRAGLLSFRQSLVEAGLASEAEVASLAQALQDAPADDHRWVASPLMVELIARVP